MKLRLIYLLFFGLIFFQAYSYTTSSNKVDTINHLPAFAISDNSSLWFTDCSTEKMIPLSSLFIEDSDDEDSYERKKTGSSHNHVLSYNGAVISLHHLFKKYTASGKGPWYSIPHRYLFIRSIRV